MFLKNRFPIRSTDRQLIALAQATKKLPGDMAEVGVYRGKSAPLTHVMKISKTLHVFDTFEELPDPSSGHKKSHHLYNLGRLLTISIHRGAFPASANGLEDRWFSFVHLDVDLHDHDGMRASLEWFYPRMTHGGAILCNNYQSGLRKAIDEFFRDKPEIVIPLPVDAHCLIVRSTPASP